LRYSYVLRLSVRSLISETDATIRHFFVHVSCGGGSVISMVAFVDEYVDDYICR